MSTLETRLLALVEQRDYVSMVEVTRELPETVGDLAWCSAEDENIIFWNGVSPAFLDALRTLREREVVRFTPGSTLSYFVDGAVPNMPVAKHPPKGGYRTPHWLPVYLRPGPAKAAKKKGTPHA
jgi:hypothetical protein